MKKIYLFVFVLCAAAICGCDNKPAQAQALLIEAIDWGAGGSSQQSQTKALEYAASKGFKLSDAVGSLTQRELVMTAGRLRCQDILGKYPTTPAAIRAAELEAQIDRQLRELANIRIQSLYANPNE